MAYLAKSLWNLRAEVNKRYPRRDKASDGWLGDWRHQRTVSDHNPGPGGVVRALDIDKDGIDPWFVVARAIKHPSTNYVIFNRTIWSRDHGFKARRYYGSNPHDKHIHVSVRHTAEACNSSRVWLGTAPTPKPTPKPTPYPSFPGTVRAGQVGPNVRSVQARLKARGWKIGVDGRFGPETERVVRAYQKDKHLSQDGVVGPATWKSLWTAPISK